GFRHRENREDLYAPQLLYTIRIQHGFDVIGSVVNVYRTDYKTNLGQTYDVALRIPIPKNIFPDSIKDAKLAIGAFKSLGGNIYPTYSIDLRF
ncbi:MAG: hypothetical protein L3J61_02055, partial [Ghiorsea sp.]|nr:hypothetical protein [Ghiorsea sp.]